MSEAEKLIAKAMSHDKRLSQISRAWCAKCGNNATTTTYDGKTSPFLIKGVDWSSDPNSIEDLLKYHHAAIFTIIVNQ